MRILIYSLYFHPELTGISKIVGQNADWLAARGHEVRVLTAMPHYPAWRRQPGYPVWTYRREQRSGMTIWRCPLWVPPRPGGLSRLLYLSSFALTSLPLALGHLAWRPELVMLIEPPLMCAPAALTLAWLSRAVSWLNIKDYELDAAFSLGLLRSRRGQAAALRLESALLRRFTRVSSISPAMVARACSKGSEPERTLLFRDWVDLARIRPDPEAAQRLRQSFGIAPHKYVVLYSGNLGVKQGVEILVDAAEALAAEPDVLFLICGEGAALPAFQRHAARLPNLRLRGLVPEPDLNALLQAADLHVLPQRREAAELVMPSKLLYMLASGRPILATADPTTEVGKLVLRGGGRLAPPGDGAELARIIRACAADRAQAAAAAAAGRRLAELEFGQEAVLQGFMRELRKALRPRPACWATADSDADEG